VSLKPQNLVQAAEADLRRRRHNEYLAKVYGRSCGMFEQYAFNASHVRKAKSVLDLLRLALMHPVVKTTKSNTKLIYGNGALLFEAIKLRDRRIRVKMGRHDEEENRADV
jgi:hypothetical protein